MPSDGAPRAGGRAGGGGRRGQYTAPAPADGTLQVPAGGDNDTATETLYYEAIGDGEPLVLSQGAGRNHPIWFEHLAFPRRHKVLTWNQRSFGSATDHSGRRHSEAFAADFLTLLDNLGIDKALA